MPAEPLDRHDPEPTQTFTPVRSATLRATMDRIIPADEFPSASQAGGIAFIERLFATDLASRLDELRGLIDAIEGEASRSHHRPLADLSAEQQDDVLRAIEQSPLRRRFEWLVGIVTEGYYADPANGGNDGAASWRMVGYDPRVPGYPAAAEAHR